MERSKIFEHFGNELEPVAVFPENLLSRFSEHVVDTMIYSGKGYFLDHAVHNHPEFSPQLYAEGIQSTIDNYTEVFLDESPDKSTGKNRNSLVFMQNIGEGKKMSSPLRKTMKAEFFCIRISIS